MFFNSWRSHPAWLLIPAIALGGIWAFAQVKAYRDDLKLTPQERAEKALRGPEPLTDMKGVAQPIRELLDKYAYDPSRMSFTVVGQIHVDKRYPEYWCQEVTIRAPNGFGALIVDTQAFFMNSTGCFPEEMMPLSDNAPKRRESVDRLYKEIERRAQESPSVDP